MHSILVSKTFPKRLHGIAFSKLHWRNQGITTNISHDSDTYVRSSFLESNAKITFLNENTGRDSVKSGLKGNQTESLTKGIKTTPSRKPSLYDYTYINSGFLAIKGDIVEYKDKMFTFERGNGGRMENPSFLVRGDNGKLCYPSRSKVKFISRPMIIIDNKKEKQALLKVTNPKSKNIKELKEIKLRIKEIKLKIKQIKLNTKKLKEKKQFKAEKGYQIHRY